MTSLSPKYAYVNFYIIYLQIKLIINLFITIPGKLESTLGSSSIQWRETQLFHFCACFPSSFGLRRTFWESSGSKAVLQTICGPSHVRCREVHLPIPTTEEAKFLHTEPMIAYLTITIIVCIYIYSVLTVINV